MRLGWKVFLPFTLLWVILTSGLLVAFDALPNSKMAITVDIPRPIEKIMLEGDMPPDPMPLSVSPDANAGVNDPASGDAAADVDGKNNNAEEGGK